MSKYQAALSACREKYLNWDALPTWGDCHPRLPKEVCVEELYEWDGENFNGTAGFYAKGHWDRRSFAIAVNQEFGLAELEKPAYTSDVRHGFHSPDYCDPESMEEDGPMECLHFSFHQSEGSWPITVFDR